MIPFLDAIQSNPLLLSAVLAGVLASLVSGIIGSYVVVKRIVFICGGISHSVLGGIGFCLWLERAKGVTWATPLLGALVAAISSALIIGWIHLSYRQREDSVIASLWSVGMATGVVFIAQTPGFNVELTNFLVGNILWVSTQDLWILASLDFLILGVVCLLHKKLLAVCFDEEHAYLQGLPVKALYLLLLVLTALSIVLLIQIVGIILVMTMLTIPAVIANLFTSSLSRMMLLAVGLSVLFTFFGTGVAYQLDWPGGATIALLAGGSYLVCLLLLLPIKKALNKQKARLKPIGKRGI